MSQAGAGGPAALRQQQAVPELTWTCARGSITTVMATEAATVPMPTQTYGAGVQEVCGSKLAKALLMPACDAP